MNINEFNATHQLCMYALHIFSNRNVILKTFDVGYFVSTTFSHLFSYLNDEIHTSNPEALMGLFSRVSMIECNTMKMDTNTLDSLYFSSLILEYSHRIWSKSKRTNHDDGI